MSHAVRLESGKARPALSNGLPGIGGLVGRPTSTMFHSKLLFGWTMVVLCGASILGTTLTGQYPAAAGIVVGGLLGATLVLHRRDRFNNEPIARVPLTRFLVLSPVLLAPGLALVFVGSVANGVGLGFVQFLGGVWLAFWLAMLGTAMILQHASMEHR